MGIHGLWRLLEPAGRDVTLESLENKVLAIDVSLWLHQAQQGASYGGAGVNAPNAHLLTLFHRISKLLFYRVKPVFIFDGAPPEMKKKTIFARKQRKQVASKKAKDMQQQLLLSLAKNEILRNTSLQDKHSLEPKKKSGKSEKGNVEQGEDDLYILPSSSQIAIPSEEPSQNSPLSAEEDGGLMSYFEVEEESEVSEDYESKGKVQGGWKKWNTWIDPHEVDLQSKEFQALPVDVRREILTDLKEARKQSSWGRLHTMPKELGSFSSFQMSRLLHRRKVQEVLEKVEEEVASSEVQGTSLKELEVIMAEKGIESVQGNQRIASDENKGFILLSRLKDQSRGDEIGDKKLDAKFDMIKEEAMDGHGKKEGMKKEQSFDVGCSEWTKEEGMMEIVEVNDDIEMATSDSEVLWPKAVEENASGTVTKLAIGTRKASDGDTDLRKRSKLEKFILNSLDEDSCDEDLSQGELMAIIKTQVSEAGKSGSGSIRQNEIKELPSCSSNAESVEELKGELEIISEIKKNDNSELIQEGAMRIVHEERSLAADEKEVRKDEIFNWNASAVIEQSQNTSKDQIPKGALKIDSCEGVAQVTSQQFILSETDEKVKDNGSGDSESDGSDFLEVEESEEITVISNNDGSCVAAFDSSKDLAKPISTPKVNKDLEVIVNLVTDSDDDMFADVFKDVEVKKHIEDYCAQKPNHSLNLDGVENEGHVGEPGINEKHTKEKFSRELETHKKIIPDNECHGKEQVLDVEMSMDEIRQLALETRKLEQQANGGVTEKARLECQELLGLFGVPWVVAPFEAEAQCAFFETVVPDARKRGASSSVLCSQTLVEGTVTEDSDVWAFGSSVVYRHVFDRRMARVRKYSKEEIQKRIGLNRTQIIQLALLTGSDYTLGLPGIGTVTALEVMAAFPGEKNCHSKSDSDCEVDEVISGLQHFSDWWRRVEMNEMERTPIDHSDHDPPEAVCVTLRRRLFTCWKSAQAKQPGISLLPPGFPSRAVVKAYLQPTVDESKEIFSWRKPDEAALRSYAKVHFGWTSERIESVIRPLFVRLKLSDKMDRTQMSLHSYFSHSAISKSIDLKGTNLGFRTQKALERIAGKCEEQLPVKHLDANEAKEDVVQGTIGFDEADYMKQEIRGKLRNKFIKQNVKARGISKGKTYGGAETTAEVVNYKKRVSQGEMSVMETGFQTSLYSNAKIPQREKDNAHSLQSKLKAIEVMRKASLGSGKRAAPKRMLSKKKKLKREQVKLSESSDSDD